MVRLVSKEACSGSWKDSGLTEGEGFNHRCTGDPDLTRPSSAHWSPMVYLPAITFTQYLKITFVINVQFN